MTERLSTAQLVAGGAGPPGGPALGVPTLLCRAWEGARVLTAQAKLLAGPLEPGHIRHVLLGAGPARSAVA